MIKFENVEVIGWEAAIRGMRNPMNSWEQSDTDWFMVTDPEDLKNGYIEEDEKNNMFLLLGEKDLELMLKLSKAGTDHRKFMRMIMVYVDITAPLYWWKEFDTYKVGTVANSCSTMHKIHAKEFTLEDFSCEHLISREKPLYEVSGDAVEPPNAIWLINRIIQTLNQYRDLYLQTKNKKYWWQMIQLLPSSYNQRRTVMMNYEVLANIYKSRKSHKLDEWSVTSFNESDKLPDKDEFIYGFCDWIQTLPYSELITGNKYKE